MTQIVRNLGVAVRPVLKRGEFTGYDQYGGMVKVLPKNYTKDVKVPPPRR